MKVLATCLSQTYNCYLTNKLKDLLFLNILYVNLHRISHYLLFVHQWVYLHIPLRRLLSDYMQSYSQPYEEVTFSLRHSQFILLYLFLLLERLHSVNSSVNLLNMSGGRRKTQPKLKKFFHWPGMLVRIPSELTKPY